MGDISEKNRYGEKIHFKLENGVVMIHHTDCTEDYITLNDLILKHNLDSVELVLIYNACKKLFISTLIAEDNHETK